MTRLTYGKITLAGASRLDAVKIKGMKTLNCC